MADVMAIPQQVAYQPMQHPSPTQDLSGTPGSVNSARRPPRKSTLTQQQKNQKRQRATQDQLMTLEVEFNENPTPTALVRERIAQDINMTERSVQIWFQNRRAKIKNIAKRSIEQGEDCDSIPESMRQYLAMQAYGPGAKGLSTGFLGRPGPGFPQYGGGPMSMTPETPNGKVVIQHFACRSLSIGSWRRVGQSTMDLVIFYSPDKACVTYYINNDHAGYKIEYPFAWIKNISLEQGDVIAAAEGASQRSGGLVIELNHAPKFYMDSSGSGGFYECGDFTEDQQASKMMIHQLGGPSKVLSGQLAKLVSLEAYRNRHMTFDPTQFVVSAPVPPMRPSSQPNHLVHPHHNNNNVNMFAQDHQAGLMGPPAPRGHKRQRSRSVPAAIDFSMLRGPMPSFLIQQENQQAQAAVQDSNIFAPLPQNSHNFSQAQDTSNLTIDTSATFGGMGGGQFTGPLSATTANSPSEYGTPAFFTTGPPSDNIQSQFSTPFNNGYLAVDAAAMIGTANTPLPVGSHHGDPVIADHSPPMSGMGRSASVADIFGTPGDVQFGDDGFFLAESFNQKMALPFRSPMSDVFTSPMADGTFSFQSTPNNGDTPQMQLQSQPGGNLSFDCPPSQGHDGSMIFSSPTPHPQGPQNHQDSGIAFSTPSHVTHQDQMNMFTPNESGMVFHDSGKIFSSPGQMNQQLDEKSMYQTSPLGGHGGSMSEELDMNNLNMYGTVDPQDLGQPPQ
ncbi:Hypothetical protein R9X50_00267000 [Acrodontium crateriforme]|uniref:Homeobox domain-containing protein n=1 Tax=Acrodontium crateriforme TaxID=150365 RepID=A0AAQ3R8Q6_9PEZI|nr:Hypothetical protein R9X50_00267000 [Acrodontium crateriforme]